MGIHKYGLDTSSSQLGIKSLGTRVLRDDWHASRACIVCSMIVIACFVLNTLSDMCGDV